MRAVDDFLPPVASGGRKSSTNERSRRPARHASSGPACPGLPPRGTSGAALLHQL